MCGALWWDRDRGAEQIEELVARRAENAIGRFGTPMVKIMLDGVAENFTAAVTEPYLGGHGNGLSFVDFDALPGYVKALSAAGFGVHFHAIGDAAVRAALDAVAAAGQRRCAAPDRPPPAGRSPGRAALRRAWRDREHAAVLGLPRAAARRARVAVPGPGAGRLAVPLRRPARARGARLAAGSDWPVTTANPWEGMQVAVTRAYHGDEVLLPAQRLDLVTALTAYTQGSAYANGCDEAGVIEAGTPGRSGIA